MGHGGGVGTEGVRHWALLDRKNVPEGRPQLTITHCTFYENVEENSKDCDYQEITRRQKY